MMFVDSNCSEPPQRSHADASGTSRTHVWRTVRRFWCRHRQTTTIPKAHGMPAHVVCDACGWREPVMAATPKGTRTWDSSRDEARYQREKMRREAVEAQRHLVTARRAAPERLPARRLSGTIVALKRAVGE